MKQLVVPSLLARFVLLLVVSTASGIIGSGCSAASGCRCSGNVDGVGRVELACGDASCISGVGLRCVSDETLAQEPAVCGHTSCGDGICSGAESTVSCAVDCPARCGDGMCTMGESCSACAADCGACMPDTVTVELIGGIVQPFADGGETWDGLGNVPLADQERILDASLETGDPYVVVATVVGLIANAAWMDVDVHGNANIAIDGTFVDANNRFLDAISDNTPNAEWAGPPGWTGVPSSRARIRLSLYDEDVSFNDQIGTVELDAADLEAAYRAGRVYPVPVADQGTPVLFIRISVH